MWPRVHTEEVTEQLQERRQRMESPADRVRYRLALKLTLVVEITAVTVPAPGYPDCGSDPRRAASRTAPGGALAPGSGRQARLGRGL
jgi:hypothetical protein